MLPEVHSHAVFGFSENLDWSILNFVKPIDDIRVCSACGVVARKTAFLPCRHVLCEPCYEQWKTGVKVCFLDGELCPENEVYRMEFPAERMMRREVSCWNRRNGCETITDVSSIAEHFHRDCAYHCTCCPKCSSTVLRRDIIAHLQSHCTTHVLHRKSTTSRSEDVSKDVEYLRGGLAALESAFGNARQNDAHLLSNLPGIAANNEDNLNALSVIADEVEQVAQVMMHALSEVESTSEGRVNQRLDIRNFGARLCAELDEIKRIADEGWSCEITTRDENMKREEHVENLELLQREVRSILSKLQLKKKTPCDAAAKKCAAEELLTEVLSVPALACEVICDKETIKLEGFVRVIENELMVPVKVVWGVRNWSKLTHKIKANKFTKCGTDVAVADRYKVYLRIIAHPSDSQRFQFWPCVKKEPGATLAASPKRMAMVFVNRGRGDVEHELYRTRSGSFLTYRFGVQDLEGGGSVHDDRLEVCFKFVY
ncbi:uncharacterized protein LOC119401964 [Rhipicephalus sanguineus]|uniref:uncharacterized protein LOC119401964 n=1 Tax=Rhipicephalus sanguineus TaxID=34632 RepID=UPI0018956BFB|nr:uncharacterized protein LOC119401964 [Rhipicephalus sanguineus]